MLQRCCCCFVQVLLVYLYVCIYIYIYIYESGTVLGTGWIYINLKGRDTSLSLPCVMTTSECVATAPGRGRKTIFWIRKEAPSINATCCFFQHGICGNRAYPLTNFGVTMFACMCGCMYCLFDGVLEYLYLWTALRTGWKKFNIKGMETSL